jgi:hypothetical protein
MVIGSTIRVAAGRVTGYHGIRFGGFAGVPATGQHRAWMCISVRDNTGEFGADLREGDTINVAGQTWRLDKIRNPSAANWHADLTRIAGPTRPAGRDRAEQRGGAGGHSESGRRDRCSLEVTALVGLAAMPGCLRLRHTLRSFGLAWLGLAWPVVTDRFWLRGSSSGPC